MGRLVLPIFYNIEPSVARHQIGRFKEAFEKDEGRVAMEVVNKWRGTLKDVADLAGYYVRNEVRDLCIKLMDHEASGNSGSSIIDGVNWIGIYGMEGQGKTTLAKAFYNQVFRDYEGSCFVADVKDICAGSKCHVSLQKQLIDDVLKRKNTTMNQFDKRKAWFTKSFGCVG